MKMNKFFVILAFFVAGFPVWASTPGQIFEQLNRAAREVAPGFSASAQRGEALFRAKLGTGEAESCMTCHTPDARRAGQHFRTNKLIEPLAPSANQARFTDMAHVEKWFRRNCREVLGRTCTAQEKADFVAYMKLL